MALLDDAIRDLLRPIIKSTAAIPVRYHSGLTGLVYDTTPTGDELVASLDITTADAETAEGMVFTEQLKDFKIDVTDLPIAPTHLDRIEIVRESDFRGTSGWFQVLGNGSKSVQHNDNFNIAWRIHTNEIPAPQVDTIAYGAGSGEAYGTFEDIAYGRTQD